ncbi:NAD(P)H nitroreductase [Mycobacterium sp.]|uniref:Acg family FMN-binding oxidoreductase n=1 Tax=Mycobacterium sp. TaxID=1785 RepID=UPI001285FC58|nr:NAD(P)H nitroreductase [Mycobacterium sp.]KAA8964646.1 MAG: NAD(P)H nitroreductase [Mycobacterium sp.]
MPTTTVGTEVIRQALQLASRAPSLHNIQPWRWVLTGTGQLQLFLDQDRVTVSDRCGREAVMGCGAMLDHLRVAMAAAGWQTQVDRFPDPDDPNLLASIDFTPAEQVRDADRRRAAAIAARRSDRLPLNAPQDWEELEPVLRDAVEAYAVHLDVLPDEARPDLANASQFAESLRLYNSAYHNEIARWTAPFEASEGIPYSSLISAAEGDRVNVGRVFPVAQHAERRVAIGEDHATVLALSTDADNRSDALATGEALSAVLLECTLAGLATCPISHMTEVRVSRELVSSWLPRNAVPQILVRVGSAPAGEDVPPPTPRRPLADILHIAP